MQRAEGEAASAEAAEIGELRDLGAEIARSAQVAASQAAATAARDVAKAAAAAAATAQAAAAAAPQDAALAQAKMLGEKKRCRRCKFN